MMSCASLEAIQDARKGLFQDKLWALFIQKAHQLGFVLNSNQKFMLLSVLYGPTCMTSESGIVCTHVQ